MPRRRCRAVRPTWTKKACAEKAKINDHSADRAVGWRTTGTTSTAPPRPANFAQLRHGGASDARPIVAITRSANEAAVLHGSGQHDAAGVVRLRPAVPAIRPTPTSKSLTTPAAPATRNGGNRVGPHPRDIFGRKAGSLPGYRYSDAMKSVDFAWDEEKLCASLKIRMRWCRATA
jgi:hypothetical protein